MENQWYQIPTSSGSPPTGATLALGTNCGMSRTARWLTALPLAQICIKRSAINGRCEVYSSDKEALAIKPLTEAEKARAIPSAKKVTTLVEAESELIQRLKRQ